MYYNTSVACIMPRRCKVKNLSQKQLIILKALSMHPTVTSPRIHYLSLSQHSSFGHTAARMHVHLSRWVYRHPASFQWIFSLFQHSQLTWQEKASETASKTVYTITSWQLRVVFSCWASRVQISVQMKIKFMCKTTHNSKISPCNWDRLWGFSLPMFSPTTICVQCVGWFHYNKDGEPHHSLVWCPHYSKDKNIGDLHDKLFQLPHTEKESGGSGEASSCETYIPTQKLESHSCAGPHSPETHKVAKGLASAILV